MDCSTPPPILDRHEIPEKSDLSNQNIKDRYYGRNDPVAKKMLSGFAGKQGLQPPEDTSIVSLEVRVESALELYLTKPLPDISFPIFAS